MSIRDLHEKTSPELAITAARHVLYEAPPAFKTYPRFPQKALPTPCPIESSLSSLIETRETRYDYQAGKSVPLQALSDILFCAAGISKTEKKGSLPAGVVAPPHRRHHPSAGGLYPLEYYVAALRVEGLPRGIYHFAPESHVLEHITIADIEGVRKNSSGMIPDQDPAVIIVITSAWGRNYPKYGDFAYRLTLLEAGHSAQNLILAATARSLKSGTMGGMREKPLARALGLHEDDFEDPLYQVFLGV